MLFRAVIVSLGYLWLFTSNSLKLCFKIFFFTGVSNYCEERKLTLYQNIKKFRWQFFKFRQQLFGYLAICYKRFGIPESKFSAFYEHNRDSLILPVVVSPGRT